MRTPFIVGNWKMNKTAAEAIEFVHAVADELPAATKVESAVAVSPLYVQAMAEAAKGSPLEIMGENIFYEQAGAYTGEVSPQVLKEVGANYVLLGHSERRMYFHESDEIINRKVFAALKAGLKPIICCDETMGRQAAGDKIHWVVSQILTDLRGLTDEQMKLISIAYEPSWAIGTGKSATAEQAEEGCYLLRQTVADIYNDEIANGIRVLYGGSVNPSNIADLMDRHDIDGVLVGNASLDPDSFLKLVNYK